MPKLRLVTPGVPGVSWLEERRAVRELATYGRWDRNARGPMRVREFLASRFNDLLEERDELADALRLVALTADASLLDEANDEDDLFRAELVTTEARHGGLYVAVLTTQGRQFVLNAIRKADPS
jgi:hypothetical protein